ncbi:hypothetical protein QQF64_017345 [Cirrhinus molitorella]|uniref:Uncharacterized protein n=1 Tax=Cirrhinus molitorella TaxID=172907 RepID=A0ABR3LIE9_9TELE
MTSTALWLKSEVLIAQWTKAVALHTEDSNNENLDDVQCWSTTQLRTWDSVTFSSEQDIDQDIESEVGQDEESETVRRQTPYVFHMSDDEEVVDEDMSEEDSIGTELRNASQRHETMLDDQSQWLCQNNVQNGGSLTDTITTSAGDSTHMASTSSVDEHSAYRRINPPTGNNVPPCNNMVERPSTSRAPDSERPLTSRATFPSGTTQASRANIDSAIRSGGTINGYRVSPRPRFNSADLHQTMNMREIMSTDLASCHLSLHNTMAEIARNIGGDGAVINLNLNSLRLRDPVNAVLSPGNNYDVNLFTDQIEKIVQSNDSLSADDAVEIEASVVMSRQGGGRRRKLTDLALDQVIKRKKMCLFSPINISNKLCFSLCLAHFLDPQLPVSELESHAAVIHNNAGFSIQDAIGLHDIARFEDILEIKIVVFYRTNDGGTEIFKNHHEPHPKTVFLYLYNEHYHTILNLKAFIGADYVCGYCYKGYSNPRHHGCRHVCNVCFDRDCYKHPKSIVHCPDCLRYCSSNYCYRKHKQPPPGWGEITCDVIKYCNLCNRRYEITCSNKHHTCAPVRCIHCHEDLPGQGDHKCFIQPQEPKPPSRKYVYYDFESRYENGKHIGVLVCAITFKGRKFVAEGTDCVARLITWFRQPRYKGYTFIAYYASRFDSFLILEYFCNAGLTIDIIMQGCKLIYMYDDAFAQRYIDSYSFIPMALSKMPSALNLTTTEKGYFQPDSMIFVSREGDWMPSLGDHLGELTDEIGDDSYITEFCSSGPKSYAYRTSKGKVCVKAKGIILNAKNSQAIRLDSMIGLVTDYTLTRDDTQYILTHSENIVRNKKTLTLHNKSVDKRYKVVYNKRRLLPDFNTLPYGY